MACDTELMPIECLETGDSGTIMDISGDCSTVTRLAEMGICCGCRVTVKRSGSALWLRVNDHDVMLRCGQAALILVAVGSSIPVL
ncbi:MAG: ferrous iron transport protein A [Planctomycetaceae bacterium]|nr:ferrous iron transport protein A [Planctomycetaceae bacterium]